jgi:hypothetical protein
MMSERASVFDSTPDFDVSGFTPQKPKASAPREKVRQVSEGSEFRSREPEERPIPKRRARRHVTGRNIHLGIKVTRETYEAFYQIADEQGWVLGETLERAVEALKEEIAG